VTSNVVDVSIVTGVPLVKVLVEAVKPISGGWQVDNLLAWNSVRNENGNGMADEHVSSLDVTPEEVPDIGLRRASLGNKVAPDLNVGSVQDRTVRSCLLDERD
jgi:hypothetical protein